ncbi:MAG: RimK family alpha-L-glutamate ligase [Alphaproteobacteria bacterium]
MRPRPKVALFSDSPDWHARRLSAALAARGTDCVCLSLTNCAFQAGDAPGGGASGAGLLLPGFEDGPPDGALVRFISAGTLEQITLRLDMLHALDALGIPVYNDARAIERTVDKSMTTFLLQRAGLPTPPTWATESRERARAIVESEIAAGQKVVLKPLFGAQGKGLRLLRSADELPEPEAFNGTYYLQRYVDTGEGSWHDWRVLVVGQTPIAAMIRRGKHWITNVMQGATCERAAAEGEPAHLAVAATRAVGAGYAGVDIVRDGDGRFLILEVNSVPAWKGLQSVTDLDVAQTIVDDFLARIPAAGPRAAAM